jgi:hypothetical protein
MHPLLQVLTVIRTVNSGYLCLLLDCKHPSRHLKINASLVFACRTGLRVLRAIGNRSARSASAPSLYACFRPPDAVAGVVNAVHNLDYLVDRVFERLQPVAAWENAFLRCERSPIGRGWRRSAGKVTRGLRRLR